MKREGQTIIKKSWECVWVISNFNRVYSFSYLLHKLSLLLRLPLPSSSPFDYGKDSASPPSSVFFAVFSLLFDRNHPENVVYFFKNNHLGWIFLGEYTNLHFLSTKLLFKANFHRTDSESFVLLDLEDEKWNSFAESVLGSKWNCIVLNRSLCVFVEGIRILVLCSREWNGSDTIWKLMCCSMGDSSSSVCSESLLSKQIGISPRQQVTNSISPRKLSLGFVCIWKANGIVVVLIDNLLAAPWAK